MEFETRLTVDQAPERVWAFLWSVERLAACIPGCEQVEVLEAGRRYRARLGDRIGPFRVDFAVGIEVTAAEPPRRLAAVVTGEDGRLGSRVRGALEVSLEPAAAATAVTLRTTVDVLGRVATVGQSVIRRRVQEHLAEMGRRVKAALDPADGPAAV